MKQVSAGQRRSGKDGPLTCTFATQHLTLPLVSLYFICHFRPGSFEAIQQEAFQTHDHKLANFKCDSFFPRRLTSNSIDVNLRIVNSVDPKAQFAAVHVASYKLCNKVWPCWWTKVTRGGLMSAPEFRTGGGWNQASAWPVYDWDLNSETGCFKHIKESVVEKEGKKDETWRQSKLIHQMCRGREDKAVMGAWDRRCRVGAGFFYGRGGNRNQKRCVFCLMHY